MIGFIILSIALLNAGYAQEYEGRGRSSYRSFDDDEVEVAKPAPTVVPILKQIDKHNDDGSYTYGFEAADGSFKIETKQANGEVRGKYGYTDATGKLHVVEYGANKHGFQPTGEGIMVPPVNLNAEPEPEYEEEIPRRVQAKPIQPRRPQPAVQQIQPWEQERAAPVQQVIQAAPRPKPAQPHIVYNSPAPKRPQFFAGAQPIPDGAAQQSYEASYQDAVAPRKQAQLRPQQERTIAYAAPASSPRPAPRPKAPVFDHSAQFRQNVQFAPAPKAVQYERPVEQAQLFRPEPVRNQFAELDPYEREDERSFAPAPAPAPRPAPRAPAPRPKSSGGFLDQLEQQFSLPSGSATPTHNIAFGFY